MNIFELFGTIAIDHSEADRSLDKVTGNAKDAESKLEKTFKRIGSFAAAAFSVTAIVNFGKTCTQVYADVAAEQAAFEQVMGDYASTAQAKLDAVANQTGITATRMTGAFNSLTAKFKGLGYDTEDATTLAADGLMIAADASAFWNVSMDEAMAHLNSFINGSYEGGEAIGLFANDTQMAAYAVEKGIVADAKAWASLDEATKQATRLDYARTMQQNSGVTGQAAKEADAYQNVLGNLTEAWKQFQAIIGKPILERIVLPAMRKLNEIMPGINEAVQKGIDWLTAGFDKIAAYFSEVFTEDGLDMKAFPSALKNMFRDAARSIPALLSSVGRAIRTAWVNTVWPAVQGAIKVAFGVDLPEWSKIESDVIKWWGGLDDGIAAKIAGVCNWTLSLFGKPADVTPEQVSTVLNDWWTKTKSLVQGACTWVLNLFNPPESDGDTTPESIIKTWWKGVVGAVQGACTWVLNLFNPPENGEDGTTPESIIKTWWKGVVKGVQDVCTWVLNLFDPPKDDEDGKTPVSIISDWWSGVVEDVQGACTWFLNLFDPPKDGEDGKTPASIVSDWWAGVVDDVQSACTWFLNLFNPPKNEEGAATPESVIKTWWKGVVKGVQDVCTWVLNLFDPPASDGETTPESIIKTWWTGVVASVQGACNWFLNLFNPPKNGEDGTTPASIISDWWKGVVDSVQGVCVWFLNLFSPPKNGEDGATPESIIKTWWTGVVASVQGACAWFLNLFNPPKDGEDGTTPESIISDWWRGVVGAVQGACNWVLNLFNPPKDGEDGATPVSIISDWWKGVVASVQGACTWVLNLFDPPKDSEDGTSAVSIIETWWSGVVEAVQNACVWFLNLFNPPKDGEEGAETPASVISKWWNGVVKSVQDACKWVLNLFTPPDEGAAQTTLIDWWDAIWARLRDVLTIDLSWLDLSGLDITHVFVAGKNAIQGVVNAAKTFYTEVLNSLETDEEGKLELEATLSNLFDAGVTAAKNLLSVAGNLVGEIVTAVTGDEEAGEKIGAVFGELFSWASEIVIGVKEGAIVAFEWLVNHKAEVVGALTGISVAMIMMAAANPAIAVISAIVGLITLMTTDWENFEQNYPELTGMFEKLTGLDFTDVANSLDSFKGTLGDFFTFLNDNRFAVDLILMLAGAIAVGTGHVLMGAAFLTAGGYGVWDEAVEIQKKNLEVYGEPTTPMEDYLYYAKQMYRSPGEYGLTESELSGYIDTLGRLDPSKEGYREAAEAVVEAWMNVHGPNTYTVEKVNDAENPVLLKTPPKIDPEKLVPSGGMQNVLMTIQAALAQNNEAQRASVQEGIIAGFSGATVQVDVSAGNITLQDGTLVGRFMPKINAALGAAAARSQRTKG